MQRPFKQVPIGGMNLDSDELRIKPEQSAFLKNLTVLSNLNPSGNTNDGANLGVLTPYEGFKKLTSPVFPPGSNMVIGYYDSKETNEGYVFVYNAAGLHFIYKVNGIDGTLQFVYKSPDLNFQLDPKHFIAEGRCVIDVQGKNKYLIFTDNYNPQRMICVDDSMATDSFNTTTYPYFGVGGNNCQHEYLINLGVAPPMDCIGIAKVPRDDDDKMLQNFLVNSMWQFRVKFIDVYNRESEHGVISEMISPIVGGGGCLSSSSGVPRCFDLTFDAGCALVNRVQIEFRKCFGRGDLTTTTDWYLYDTINKYDESNPAQHYWERSINPDITYNGSNNTIKYRFCGDKSCYPIDIDETNRFYNPLPLLSSSLFKLDRGIGVANNVRGFDKLNDEELDKLDFTVTSPDGGDCNSAQKRKIVVYALIWNPYELAESRIREKNGKIIFGNSDCSNNNPISYDMILANTEGWVGYLAGTPYAVVSEQVQHLPGLPYTTDVYAGPYGQNPFFLYQRWIFEVPPGKYVFRIGHHSTTLNADYAKTSTYTIGRNTFAAWNAAKGSFTERKELIIDVCNGDHISDHISDEFLIIYDLTFTNNKTLLNCLSNATTIVDGYVREDQVNNIPIENAIVSTTTGFLIYTNAAVNHAGCDHTDHNGFYFTSGIAKKVTAWITFNDCVRLHQLKNEDAIDNWNSQVGHKAHRDLWAYTGSDTYPDAGHRIIKGTVSLCGEDTFGVSGVLVVRATGAWGYTDANGQFSIICHEWYDGTTQDRLIYSQKGSCSITDCTDVCNQCFTDSLVNYVPCTGGIRITNIGNKSVNVKGLNKMGPQTGGRYGLGLIMHDWMGRCSFVQAKDKHFVDIPSQIETHAFDFSSINYDMTGIVFPSWVKYVTFCITENLNWSDFLDWSIDKVEYIDGAGNVNTASPTQIRLYYASLGEYNSKNNFATTANWEFITSQNNQDVSVAGDRVQFLLNGDGVWFDHNITALVNYDTQGKFFVIDFTQELADLKPGALFKLIRPKKCLNLNTYFEVCPVIKVNNGTPSSYTGTIKYFDSYFIERQVPVPTFTYTTLPSGQQQENKTVSAHNYGYLYEHPSPSDFWGDHCHTKGRPNVKNPQEREKRLDTEVALSLSYTNRGNYNGLSYFDTSLTKEYDRNEWGPITVVLPEVTTLLFICERANFIATYKDNRVLAEADGAVTAGSLSFSVAVRKVGNEFGCLMQDINTIRKFNGKVFFLDRTKAAFVAHTYSDADDASEKGFKSYLRRKIAVQNQLILAADNNQYNYFVGGVDPKTKEYFLTAFSFVAVRQEGTPDVFSALYVNQFNDVTLDLNETISIDTETGRANNFVSFTPEYYGSLEGYYKKQNLLAFSRGESWSSHNNPGEVVAYNNFFGFQCKKVIKPIVNISAEKVKRFMYSEVYCKQHKMYIENVTTEAGQVSRVLQAMWDYREKFWAAAYMGDINTHFDPTAPNFVSGNPIWEGDNLYGRWAAPRYISDNADDNKYCEISAIVNYVIASEQSAD